MPAKVNNANGVSACAVDAALPRTFFVMRGHIQRAFGFTREEMCVLVQNKTFAAEYPVAGGRARFVRTKVLVVARRWESVG